MLKLHRSEAILQSNCFLFVNPLLLFSILMKTELQHPKSIQNSIYTGSEYLSMLVQKKHYILVHGTRQALKSWHTKIPITKSEPKFWTLQTWETWEPGSLIDLFSRLWRSYRMKATQDTMYFPKIRMPWVKYQLHTFFSSLPKNEVCCGCQRMHFKFYSQSILVLVSAWQA